MKVIVLSDTHLHAAGELPAGVLAALAGADAVLHAGDIISPVVLTELGAMLPTYAVLGNNDVDLVGVLPERRELVLGGVRVAMVHDSGPADGRERRLRRWFPQAGLVVFGHSHLPLSTQGEDGQQLLNPGSPTRRRRAPSHTYAELVLDDGAILGVSLVELGA